MNDEPKNEENDESEKFSDDPQEQLRIENELLRLKLQAETGAELNSFSEEIPPEIENAFLNNILAFERQLDHVEEITVFEMLGTPQDIKPAAQLSNQELSLALNELQVLMEQNGVEVTFEGDYDDRLKYRFITEELFQKTTHKFDIEGMINHFIYEEFHPNFELEAEQLVYAFLELWIERNAPALEHYLVEEEAENRDSNSLEETIQKIGNLFDAYISFKNDEVSIESIEIVREPEPKAVVQGKIGYDAELENFDKVRIEGDFTFRLWRNANHWEVFSLAMPDFTWN